MGKTNLIPPISDEGLENRLIALALQQAEAQLAQGTAPSPVLTHFLRLGVEKSKLEARKIELENELLQARIDAEREGKMQTEMINEVLAALKRYSFNPGESSEDVY